MSILRISGVGREVGTLVILDSIDASMALGDRIGSSLQSSGVVAFPIQKR